MSESSDFIERWERETGQQWNSNNGDNAAMWGMIGEIARIMGKSNHDERDDVAAGAALKHPPEEVDPMVMLIAALMAD
jgi:hypothetical protein